MDQNIKFLIHSASSKLKTICSNSYTLDIQILLGHALDKDRSFVICNPEFIPNPKQAQKFNNFVERRKKQEPVSHILGYREFYSREFFVSTDVLDPRADTETLIDIVKNIFPYDSKFDFLDIGAGSGNIFTTILAEFADSQCFASDISENALKIAKNNAKSHKVEKRVHFIKSDLLEKLPKTSIFDLIISNPPYIPSKNISFLEKEVSMYDPIIALDGGNDGLDFYHKISKDAKKHLKKDGKLLFEIGFDQKKAISAILLNNNYQNLKFFKDLANNDRAILAELN
ncbi:MAG: peptide chain release factor N(5)-glutamine methyltransferase [Rickettsiales bacterium]|nr:peptide chain release factor N(5)-glutamine methyltransferase [Rickettsiales bacterium]